MYNPNESFNEEPLKFGDQLHSGEEMSESATNSFLSAGATLSKEQEKEPDEVNASASLPQEETKVYNDTSAWQSVNASPVYAVPCDNAANRAVKKKKEKKERKASGFGSKIVALALCCSLVGGIIGAGGMAIIHRAGNSGGNREDGTVSTLLQGQRENAVINVAKIDTSKQMTPAEVYSLNVNSTVGITTSVTTTNFWGYQTTAAASGSGFIISDDGYILTNYHVIEGANSVTVTMYDDTTYDAELVGYDQSNDIAVLKIDGENLTPVILGDSDELHVGDSVVAIGNPLGELTFSLTSGTVSALDRKITLSSGVSMELIQTDCAINSGNSGGALLNLYGEVIGITNAKYSGSGSSSGASIDNIGFAIPINNVSDIVKSIIEKGYISKPYIGVSVEDVSDEAVSYGLPKGAAVRTIVENGPAEKAGLKINDIITSVNGTEITCSDDLVKTIGDLKAGQEIHLSVYRQSETLDITVTVEEKIQQAKESDESQDSQKGQDQSNEGQDGQQYVNPYGDQYGQGNPFGGMNPFEFFFGY